MSIGVDIEDIDRFKDKSQEFLDRIFTPQEQQYCLSKTTPEKHFAVRFCAKEATIKALCGLGVDYPRLNEIEIYHNEAKVPQIKLLNKSDNKLTFEVSLSHDKSKAIAFVMANKAC